MTPPSHQRETHVDFTQLAEDDREIDYASKTVEQAKTLTQQQLILWLNTRAAEVTLKTLPNGIEIITAKVGDNEQNWYRDYNTGLWDCIEKNKTSTGCDPIAWLISTMVNYKVYITVAFFSNLVKLYQNRKAQHTLAEDITSGTVAAAGLCPVLKSIPQETYKAGESFFHQYKNYNGWDKVKQVMLTGCYLLVMYEFIAGCTQSNTALINTEMEKYDIPEQFRLFATLASAAVGISLLNFCQISLTDGIKQRTNETLEEFIAARGLKPRGYDYEGLRYGTSLKVHRVGQFFGFDYLDPEKEIEAKVGAHYTIPTATRVLR